MVQQDPSVWFQWQVRAKSISVDREVIQCFSENQCQMINVFHWRLILIVAYCLKNLFYCILQFRNIWLSLAKPSDNIRKYKGRPCVSKFERLHAKWVNKTCIRQWSHQEFQHQRVIFSLSNIFREPLFFGMKSFFEDLFLNCYEYVSFVTKIDIMLSTE